MTKQNKVQLFFDTWLFCSFQVENGNVNSDKKLASSVAILEQNQNVLNGVINESEINRCQVNEESKDDQGIVNPSMNPEQKVLFRI